MKEIVPAVFLMLVLLVGFPSSVSNFPAFADDNDDNDNLKVSAKESKAYKKQLEKAEKARDKAEEIKEKFEQKYNKFRDFKKDVSVIYSNKTIKAFIKFCIFIYKYFLSSI